MDIDLLLVFLLGFSSGFGHCVGMCGGIVLTYSINLQKNSGQANSVFTTILPHIYYNVGRTFTYMFLGGIFGLLGTTLTFAESAFDLQAILQVFAGIIMIYMGLDLLHLIPKFPAIFFKSGNPFKRMIHGLLISVNRSNIFALGIVLGFLPCGVVYAAGAKAASTGSIFSGMIIMLIFALGTAPAMIMMGFGAEWITGKFRSRVFKISAILVIILGGLTVYKGIIKINKPVLNHQQGNVELDCCDPSSISDSTSVHIHTSPSKK